MIRLPDRDFLFRLADAAAAETLPRFRQGVVVDTKFKAGVSFDPVTEADREAERAIRAIIGAEYPEHAILGEEFGESGEGPVRWVIDPVDGTRPFIAGIPVWGTLIGLEVEGRASIGIMSQPYTGERFYADGSGAFFSSPHGSGRLKVRDVGTLDQATLFSSSPDLLRGRLQSRFAALEEAVRLTRFGADCYAFAMLAAGCVDLCFEPGLQPYDIVALIPLIEAAGGMVTTLDGGRAEAGGDVLAAATPALHAAALAILTK